MGGHQCSKFPKRHELGTVWRCSYCGTSWQWNEVSGGLEEPTFRAWERQGQPDGRA